MAEEQTQDTLDTFGKFGKTYQEKVAQAVVQDYLFAEQMSDVLDPAYFELDYLKDITGAFFEYKRQYKTYPSPDVLEVILTKDSEDPIVREQVKTFLKQIKENPLNGDAGYIQESSLEFCKKQTLKHAIIKSIDRLDDGKYDDIQSLIKDALNKGATRDLGHEYSDGFDTRINSAIRKPIPTGWPILDKLFNGGWERKILVTFIAPTGAGKSHFLTNVSAAAVEQGLNAVYFTCEMADYKIGLRHDAYFSGVEINNISVEEQKVRPAIQEKARGRLIIKEFPTKTASVQTLRAYLQRLQALKNFTPDIVVVDYADLLRGSRNYGEKRHELEGVYEELRALAHEFNVVLVTADQTNRSGLNDEIVTLQAIAESYAKATVCDVICTISRRMEDKQTNSGRLFVAKSRLGQDGIVYPFLMNPATVKVTVLNQGEDPIALFMENNQNMKEALGKRYEKLLRKGSDDRR